MQIVGRAPRLVFHLRLRPTRQHGKRQHQQGILMPMLPRCLRILTLKQMMEERNRQNLSALRLQLPLSGNLAKRKSLRANRQAITATTATTMGTRPLPLMVKNKDSRRPVLPEVLQNNSKEGNRSSLKNSRPQEKLRRFKSPANSKSLNPFPLDPRSRQQILVFLLSTPHTKTEIVKLFPQHKFTLTKLSYPPHDQRVAKITIQSDRLQ